MHAHRGPLLQECKLCLQNIKTAPSIGLYISVLFKKLSFSVLRLVQGHTLQAVIEAVQKRVRKHRRHPDKLAEVQKWLWSYARHVAHGLAQVGSCLGSPRHLVCFPCIWVVCWMVYAAMLHGMCDAAAALNSSASGPRDWWAVVTGCLEKVQHVVQVLADLHQHRSHRDLKPQNIMVAEKRGKVSVTLIDFAGSRLNDESKRLSAAVDISSCM